MTLPRALAVLLLALGVLAFVTLFSRESPSPEPDDPEVGAREGRAPGELGADAPPPAQPAEPTKPAKPTEPISSRTTSGTPVPAEAPTPQLLRVVNEGGAPVVGAEILILDDLPDASATRRGVERPPRTTGVTAADGSYLVAADAPRAGAVRVRARGLVEVTLGLAPFPAEIRLTRARGLRVRVLDPFAKPIVGATVRAVGRVRDVEATTGPDGRAEVAADGTDWQRIETFAEGYEMAVRGMTLIGAPQDDLITVVLNPAPPLVGRVVAEEDGSPIAGAQVVLESAGGVLERAVSGSDGSFTLRVRASLQDSAGIRATAPDRLPGAFVPRVEWGNARSTEHEVKAIRLERGIAVQGVVRDIAGNPVAGASVMPLGFEYLGKPADSDAGLWRATTDADGRFQLRVPQVVRGESAYIAAQGPRGDVGAERLARDGVEAPLVIVLEGLGSVEGRVVSSAGVGMPDVRVRPSYVNRGRGITPAPADTVISSADGTFRLGPIPAGEVNLQVVRDGHAPRQWVRTVIRAGATTVLEPTSLGSGAISGVVLDKNKRAAVGVTVRLGFALDRSTRGLTSVLHETKTDVTGQFRFDGLDPSETLALHAFATVIDVAQLNDVRPRAEPYEVWLTSPPRLVLHVTRGGRLYDGPLLVSLTRRVPPKQRGEPGMQIHVQNPTWLNCVSGELVIPVEVAPDYLVEARSAEAEPATATATAVIDPNDPSVATASLELRVPEPAAPPGGMSEGR